MTGVGVEVGTLGVGAIAEVTSTADDAELVTSDVASDRHSGPCSVGPGASNTVRSGLPYSVG